MEPDDHGRYELTEGESETAATARRMRRMRRAMASGDYETAWSMALRVLAVRPEDQDASDCGEKCRSRIEAILVQDLGGVLSIPELCANPAQLAELEADSKLGSLVFMLDGSFSVDHILEMCGSVRLDVLRALHDLARRGLIRLR